eukprot:scaffold125041_cov19-Tisochrysis_lutea.AAC.1
MVVLLQIARKNVTAINSMGQGTAADHLLGVGFLVHRGSRNPWERLVTVKRTPPTRRLRTYESI